MAHEVFICFSSQDQKVAEAICSALESAGIQCWISSRDLETGTFTGRLMDAVNNSRVLVLIFSANSNNSEYCINEVHAAFNKKVLIIPFMIDSSTPSGDMEFYLQRFQQINAQEPPLEKHLSRLIVEVKRRLAEIKARGEAEAAAKEKARKEEEEKAAKVRAEAEAVEAARERREAEDVRAKEETEATEIARNRREAEEAKAKEEAEAAEIARKRREAEKVRARKETKTANLERKRQKAEEARARKEAKAAKQPSIKRPVMTKTVLLWLGVTVIVLAVIGVALKFTVFTSGPETTTSAIGVTTTPPVSHYTPTPTPTPTPIPTTTTKDKITVGMVRSLTGPNAAMSEVAFKPVYEIWLDEVNAAGGIYIAEYGKKLPIELKIYDDECYVDKVTQLTEKLILEDKVDFLWPACGDWMFLAQAPIANEHNYILIAAEGNTGKIRPMLPSMPYAFCSASGSDWNQLPALADLLAAKGCQSAFIIYIDDEYGNEYNSVAGVEFSRVGIQILGTRAIPQGTTDLTEVINEAKASGADAFMCFGYPNEIIGAINVSIELDYNPKAWLGGPGVNFGFFNAIFGPAAEGVMGWSGYSRNSSPALEALADKLYTYWGNSEANIDWWGAALYWAGLDMWKAAIEKAGTLDQTVIRDILATEHFQTILGDTWFDNGVIAKECHLGEVGQWINGVYEVVGPIDKATALFIYPKPEWPEQ